jgi:hypothetical protein
MKKLIIWKRRRPFSNGKYASTTHGTIRRNKKNRMVWDYTAPNGEDTVHDSLGEAKEFAESERWKKLAKSKELVEDLLSPAIVPTVTSILEDMKERQKTGDIPEGWTKEEFEWANRLAEKTELRTDIVDRVHTQLKARRREVAEMLRICANELENVALYPARPHLGSHLAADIVRKIYNKIKEE